jgi:KaiC/GvpD/RAD55 family RecA-like ATPase
VNTKSDANDQGIPAASELESMTKGESPAPLFPAATDAAVEPYPDAERTEVYEPSAVESELAFAHEEQEDEAWNEAELAAADYYHELDLQDEASKARRRSLNSVQTLLARPYVERGFLIGPDLLPKGGRMLITGMSGTGKSTLTLVLAACLASKKPLFGIVDNHKGNNCGEPKFPISSLSEVAYLDYELSDAIRVEKRLRPLVDQFPPEFQRNLFFPKNPSLYRLHNQVGEAKGKGSFDALETLVKSTRPDVVVVDPLSSTHSLDENSIAIKQALNNVDRLIDLYGCAAIVVHHSTTKARTDRNGKPVEKDPIEEPRGHSSLVDWCDVHMHLKAVKSADETEEDGEPSQFKIIEMSFGKARHCRKPEKRRLMVNFDAMRVSQLKKFKKTWGSDVKLATPIA